MYQKSETTIADILAAAETLFIQKNYADVTMTEIANLTNVTKGGLYHHFPSKEALYLSMLFADLEEKRLLFQKAAESKGDCRSRLQLLTESFFRLPPNKRELIRLVRRDINVFKDPAREELVRAYQTALPRQIEAIIQDGIRAGEFAETDPRLLSWQYVAMVEVVLNGYAQDTLGGPEESVEFILNLFFYGAGCRSHEPEISGRSVDQMHEKTHVK